MSQSISSIDSIISAGLGSEISRIRHLLRRHLWCPELNSKLRIALEEAKFSKIDACLHVFGSKLRSIVWRSGLNDMPAEQIEEHAADKLCRWFRRGNHDAPFALMDRVVIGHAIADVLICS